jgi:hypothetical protein
MAFFHSIDAPKVRIPEHPASDSESIRPPIPILSGH